MLPTSLTRCFEWSVHFNIKASYSGVGAGSVGTAACQVSWARGLQCWQRRWRKKKGSVRRKNGFGIKVNWNATFPPGLWLESASLWLSTPCHPHTLSGLTCWEWPKVPGHELPKWAASLQPTRRLLLWHRSDPSVRGAQLRQKMKILLRSLGLAVSPKHLTHDGHSGSIFIPTIHISHILILYFLFTFSKLPSWARAVVPKIFYVTEKAWNYYPYTITGKECGRNDCCFVVWGQFSWSSEAPSYILNYKYEASWTTPVELHIFFRLLFTGIRKWRL